MADKEKVTGDMPLRLEYLDPNTLQPNERNWREHPEAQMLALKDVVGKVGWAGACLWNASSGRLIDGHARRKLAISRGDERIPVLVGSWTEEEERLILATLDPLAAMADTNEAAYRDLLAEVSRSSPDVMRALADIADQTLPEVLVEASSQATASMDAPAGQDIIKDRYQILIEFENEPSQSEWLERLVAEGLNCRSLIV